MVSPRTNFPSQQPAAPARRKGERGFALIIAVTLLAFVVLLVVGLAALTKIETNISDNSAKQAQARANALMALNIALGQLQKYAGPDQRVTATGDLIDGATNPHYTGVWFTTDAPSGSPKSWLVSGNSGSDALKIKPTSAPSDSDGMSFVELVGRGTSGKTNDVTAPAEEIHASAVPGQSGTPTIGHYAWWVGDEGVKADAAVSDRTDTVTYSPYNTAESRRRLMQQMGLGAAAVDSDGIVIFDPRASSNASFMQRLLSWSQLGRLQKLGAASVVGSAEIAANYDNWNSQSHAVLANSADGGLRQDLSLDAILPAGGHMLGDAFANWADYSNPAYMENPASPSTPEPLPGYGTDPLRRRYKITPPELGARTGVAPILTYFYITIGVRKQNASSPYSVSMRWAVALWNPYTSALVPDDLRLEVSGLPAKFTINSRKSTAPVGSASPDVTISLRGTYGEPLKLELPWDSSKTDSDRQSWLPGRTYNWVSTADPVFNSSKTNPGKFHSRNIPAFDDGMETKIGSTTGANGSSALSVTMDEQTILTVKVFRKGDPSDKPLATYTSPIYDAVSTTDEFTASNRTSPIGFIFRLAESYDSIATDPSLWLTEEGHDVRDDEIGADLLIATPNGPHPEQYKNYITIAAPDRFFDRDVTTGTSYNEDVPLFELPRAPILSLGELQHFFLKGERPFAIGNPWGANAHINGIPGNAVFDRYFFSGLGAGVSSAGRGDVVLPNTMLKILPLGEEGSPAGVDDLKSAPAAASSRYLLQRGAFNVNSTSVAAWASVLSSTRYQAGRLFYYLDRNAATGTAGDAELQSLAPGGAVFFRFPQTAQETYKSDDTYAQTTTNPGGGGGPIINVPLFRRGLRVLSPEQVKDLAGRIVELVRLHAPQGPFRSLEEFLNPSPSALFGRDSTGAAHSLLQAAIANAGLNSKPALALNTTDPEFSSQWLTQADIMESLAPVLFARSDTFVIRAYGDVRNPATGAIEAKAWCEASVQRFPTPMEPGGGTPADFRIASGGLGRQVRVVFLRWLNSSDI